MRAFLLSDLSGQKLGCNERRQAASITAKNICWVSSPGLNDGAWWHRFALLSVQPGQLWQKTWQCRQHPNFESTYLIGHTVQTKIGCHTKPTLCKIQRWSNLFALFASSWSTTVFAPLSKPHPEKPSMRKRPTPVCLVTVLMLFGFGGNKVSGQENMLQEPCSSYKLLHLMSLHSSVSSDSLDSKSFFALPNSDFRGIKRITPRWPKVTQLSFPNKVASMALDPCSKVEPMSDAVSLGVFFPPSKGFSLMLSS